MAEESLIPSVLCMSGPPLPEWAQNTGTRQADENGSACAQEIFSQDNKLLAQLLTVPGQCCRFAASTPRASRGPCPEWPAAGRPVTYGSSRSPSRTQNRECSHEPGHRGPCYLVKLGRTAGSGAGSGELTGDIGVLERPDHLGLARAVQRAVHLEVAVKACAGMVTGSWGG